MFNVGLISVLRRKSAETIQLRDSVGLTVNPAKSVVIPSKQFTFLCLVLFSESMTVQLTYDRCQDIITKCKAVMEMGRITIIKRS